MDWSIVGILGSIGNMAVEISSKKSVLSSLSSSSNSVKLRVSLMFELLKYFEWLIESTNREWLLCDCMLAKFWLKYENGIDLTEFKVEEHCISEIFLM